MWYWRQSNFDGLKAIAEHYADRPQCLDFAEYCHLQESGLRKQAFSFLSSFISAAKKWPPDETIRFVDELITIHLANPDVHQLITYPLLQGLLLPCLRKWVVDHPEDATPHRWLGILLPDVSELDAALKLDPEDQLALERRAYTHIANVDFACHHLSESTFLGNEEECQSDLKSAVEYAERISDKRRRDNVLSEAKYFASLLEDWCEYKRINTKELFTEWCESKGREYAWSKAFYYSK